MGEGTFVSLLSFLERHAPDPRHPPHRPPHPQPTRPATSPSRSAHLERHAALDRDLRGRLASRRRATPPALRTTAGLNDDVFDALVLLAAGALDPRRSRAGWAAVQALQADMDDDRRARLARLGLHRRRGRAELSSLHTRNFM